MANGTNGDGWPYTPGNAAPRDQGDDHEDQCMARHPGFGCTCEQIQFEDRQREVAAESMPPHQTVAGLPKLDPEQLCFAIATKTGTLVTRDGRPLWASRKLWSGLPELAAQIIPITGAPPIGSMPLMNDKAGPDVVGRLLELINQLERQAAEGAKAIQVLGTIATKGAEGLENLSLIISQRIHFVELLDRAAAMIDPDSPAQLGGVSHEQRLDWLAKWREVVGR
jgi:hypothetical protein